jgi:hypothetical protein
MDRSQLSNSLTYFQAANATADAAEIGARLEREATQTSLVVRHVRGVYEADQTVDFRGAPLPVPINNDYRQDALLARLQWRPSQDSRLWGEVGYTERRYPVLSSRSFRGPTAQLGLEFKPGGALSLRADLIRDIGVPDVLSFNYVDVTELRLAPTWALTGKTAINARLSYARLSYRGDPSGIYGALRDDRLAVAGLGLAYELSRSVRASLELRHEHRTSSFDAFTFTDRVVMFGIAARF